MPPQAVMRQIDSLKKRSSHVSTDSGQVIQQQIIQLAKLYNLTDDLVEAYCRQGYIIGLARMDFNQGKKKMDSANLVVKQTGRTDLQPFVDLHYSILYKYNDSSLYYIEKVLPNLQLLKAGDRIVALSTIASIHSGRDNRKIARDYYLQALEIAATLNPRDLKPEISLYDNIAITYLFDNDTLHALEYWRKGLALITDTIEKLGEMEYLYGNFGQCYIEMNQPDSALPLIEKYADMVNMHYTNPGQRLLSNIYFAEIALQKKEYNRADTLLTSFGRYMDTIDVTSPLIPGFWFVQTYYETLFRLRKAEGKFQDAFAVLEKKREYQYLTSQKEKQDLIVQYERNAEKVKAQKALAEKEKKYANNRLLFLLAIFSLITLLSIAITFVIFFRNKKRMEERKLAALHQASLIEKKDLLLKAETTERKRIAHELHDELGGTLTVIGMATQNLKRLQMEQIAVPLDILERNSTRLSAQINEIVWSLNDNNDTLESLVAYIGRYSRQFLSDTGITYTLHTDTITNDPRRVVIEGYKRRYLFHSIKECLTNIVKHSKASLVSISMKIEQGILIIQVKDNGTGMPKPTELQKGNGLENISRNITAIKGTVTWEQQNGTTVTIKVPLRELGKEDENNDVTGIV